MQACSRVRRIDRTMRFSGTPIDRRRTLYWNCYEVHGPQFITCSRCSGNSLHRVKDLLSLRACCPKCGHRLDEVGLKMRAGCDDWGKLCTVVQIAILLEDVLGQEIEITNAELEGIQTLRDIARVIQVRLPAGSEQETRAIDLVQEAAKGIPWCSAKEMMLDAPLMDAVDPDRWSRP